MADAPKITVAELRQIVTDSGELSKGAKLYDDGDLTRFACHDAKLFADAQGSTVYKVSVTHSDKGWRAKCSCMAARTRPFCKHAAGLLVAWQRNPDGFAVATAPPPGTEPAKKKAVKASKVDVAQLMAKGVEQVTTLVRELAVVGAASIADDRAAQVRSLGENLREHRLRRLSANTIRLADLLETSRGEHFDQLFYAELLGDLLLTARKLEKHVAGETLEDRHVEELIGKTWTKKDRAPVGGLDLVEIAFLQRETPDNFVIRESRFIDAVNGDHYSEKQILPGFLVRRTAPKPSYAGKLLRGAGGGLYPGYSPRRTDLETPGTVERLTVEHLDRVAQRALPSVKQAIAALADHKKDVFAPEKLPVAIACDMVIADRGRLQFVDKDGAAIFLPDDDNTADRLATALSGVALDVVVGDLAFEGALPTIDPLAVIVKSTAGRELRSIAIGTTQLGSKKVKVAEAAPDEQRRSGWALTARTLGLSTAAIALGELREELADLVFSGLTAVTSRRVEPMAVRLGELGLAKQAELLRQAAARDEAAARLDDVIKLQQVLGIALARLAGAAHVDRDQLTASPLYASVFVRKDAELLEPLTIARKLRRGELNRFEAGALSARYYETLPPESLLERIYPLWADGAASPFIALAARQRPELGIASARTLLTAQADDDPRKVQRIRRGRHPRMATITALRVLEAVGGDAAREVLRITATGHTDATTRNLARAAMGRLARIHPADDPTLAQYRDELLNAPTLETRVRAAERLADAGTVSAIPLLRLSFAGDISEAVRDAAGRALGRLGDAESVDTFCIAIDRRADDHDKAKTAAYALGYLGDIRGVDALMVAYEAAWLPSVVAESIAAIGPAAVPALIQLVEERPTILKRTTADNVFEALRGDVLLPALIDRVDAIAKTADFVARASALLDMVKNRSPLDRELGAKILQVRPDLVAGDADRDARALAKKAGAQVH